MKNPWSCPYSLDGREGGLPLSLGEGDEEALGTAGGAELRQSVHVQII